MKEPHEPHHSAGSLPCCWSPAGLPTLFAASPPALPVDRLDRCIRGALAALLVAYLTGAAFTPAARAQVLGLRFEAGYTHDDNVTRGRTGSSDVLSDSIYSVNVTTTFVRPLGNNFRLTAGLQGGGEKFVRFDGLTRLTYGGNVGLQYRPSGDFRAPTFTLFGRWLADRYESNLRDGYRYALGLTMRQPVTDRIELSGTAQYNRREGRSTVFDGSDWSMRLNADYTLFGRHTLYAGGEYRRGDAVSVGVPWLAMIDISKSLVQDDVFTQRSRFAYRFDAETIIATVGYNWPIGNRHSLDFAWRWIHTTPTGQSALYAGTIEYRVNQLSAAYLLRF